MTVFLNTLHSARHYEILMVRGKKKFECCIHFRCRIVKFIVDLFLLSEEHEVKTSLKLFFNSVQQVLISRNLQLQP